MYKIVRSIMQNNKSMEFSLACTNEFKEAQTLLLNMLGDKILKAGYIRIEKRDGKTLYTFIDNSEITDYYIEKVD